MSVWSEEEFLKQAASVGGLAFADAHSRFLTALRRAGIPPTFDGAGEKVATYTVRAAAEAEWHILRVYANGLVILMLNHLRDYAGPSMAARAEKSLDLYLRSKTPSSPYLAHDVDEFLAMDFDGVAGAVRSIADAVREPSGVRSGRESGENEVAERGGETLHVDRNAFWTASTAEQVAARQGIHAPQPLDQIIGAAPDLWDNDEDFEQFLGSIDRHRREHTSA